MMTLRTVQIAEQIVSIIEAGEPNDRAIDVLNSCNDLIRELGGTRIASPVNMAAGPVAIYLVALLIRGRVI